MAELHKMFIIKGDLDETYNWYLQKGYIPFGISGHLIVKPIDKDLTFYADYT